MANRRHMRSLLSFSVTVLLCAAAPIAGPADLRVADAAMRGDIAAVRSLIQQRADVNGREGDGMTALHKAAERGEVDLAAVLLDAGADVGAATRIGRHTPLHVAAAY